MAIWTWIAGGACGLALVILLKKRQKDRKIIKCRSNAQLIGQTAIVTGGSSGLGREIALELVKRGCRVILACRNVSKAQKAIDYIKRNLRELRISPDDIMIFNLRLDSLDSVENFVRNVQSKCGRVDLLINNAAVMGCPYEQTVDGLELHFGVNHLGHFHLTNLLKSLLIKSQCARVINVTSGYYRKAKLDWNYVKEKPADYNGTDMYARSKLANCLNTMELAELWSGTGVKCVAVRPGFVRGTELGRYYSRLLQLLAFPLIWFISKDVQQGVQSILHCCLDEQLVNGSLYADCTVEPYDDHLVNKVESRHLWQLSEDLIRQVKLRD